ncbi:hypothetical protein HELRODRAFT_189235 [Helobdella robusta]|uniref:Uncharacterized protein n=1 Tax=Helobdella robusta TaxID=6412 RepID=T1FQU5_HELRO|nr:hypothetical protein HELRODRAFT_189235 [Helobdella robusta]ESN96434.1 hypothetical protein HELRODRAFT_189235 [Helobdella robusta]
MPFGSLDDFIMCKNSPGSLRATGMMILICGLAMLTLGIIDVVHYANCMTQTTTTTPASSISATNTSVALNATATTAASATTNSANSDFELTQIGAGIWGSIPVRVILTGVLARRGPSYPEYSLKFLVLLTLEAGFVFAPTVLIISSIDASKQVYLSCTQINNVAVSVALAVFSGLATLLIMLINYRMCCSHFDNFVDDDNDALTKHAVRPKKMFNLFAEKDQFMKSNIPKQPLNNNGVDRLPATLPQPTNTIYVPYSIMRSTAPQPQYLGGPGITLGGGGKLMTNSLYTPGSIYPVATQQAITPVVANAASVQQLQMVAPTNGNTSKEPPYFISFTGGDRINTNMYPQLYKMA